MYISTTTLLYKHYNITINVLMYVAIIYLPSAYGGIYSSASTTMSS